MYDHTYSDLANNQIRYQATQKVGCQHGDCMRSPIFLRALCGYVWVDILTLSPPMGAIQMDTWAIIKERQPHFYIL